MNTHQIFASASVTISEVWCDPGPIPKSGIEVEPAFGLSVPRTGVYVHETPRGRIVVEPSVAVIRNKGDEYRTIHPTASGDHNTDITYAPEMVSPVLDREDRIPVAIRPLHDTVLIRHHRLRSAVKSGVASLLTIEEEALGILQGILRTAPHPESTARQRAIADDAREVLAHRFREDSDLPTIAREVGASPYHLSRVFRRTTGQTLHRHRTGLRVRYALELLAQGATDLSRVAVEAGFADHAHMSNTFRRRLGYQPSVLRALIGR
jgi:AraC-like DNA-binding protein